MCDADGDGAGDELVNCVMLTTWPIRRQMIHEAIISFTAQTYSPRTLTIVNDGAPCTLSAAFHARWSGRVVDVARGSSVGAKRNAAVSAVPHAQLIASFDDDDFSLPTRLESNMTALGDGLWLSASRKLIAIDTLENVVGFESGRCYGAGLVRAHVPRRLPWPQLNYLEDQRLYEHFCRECADGGSFSEEVSRMRGGGVVEDDALVYVHRRHAHNVSAPHRKELWQGVLPLALAGEKEALRAPEMVRRILNEHPTPYLEDVEVATHCIHTSV